MMAKALVTLFLLLSTAAFASPSDQETLAKLIDIDFQTEDDPGLAEKNIRVIFETLDKKEQPRSWIKALSLLDPADRAGNLQGSLDDLIQFCREAGYTEEIIELLWLKSAELKTTGTREQVLAVYDEILPLACQENLERHWYWCGRTLSKQSVYFYQINDMPKSLESSKKALQQLDHLHDRYRFYYYNERDSLSTPLVEEGKWDQYVLLTEENVNWFLKNNFRYAAAYAAFNLGKELINQKPPDLPKIHQLFKLASDLEKQINSSDLQGLIFYGMGKLALLTQDFPAARKHFEQAYQMAKADGNPEVAIKSLLNVGEALMGMKKFKEAKNILKEAEKIRYPNNELDRMNILSMSMEIAAIEQDFKGAYAYSQEYLKAWKSQKKNEEKNQMQKVSADLGLQVQEERNKTLAQENLLQAQRLKEAERFRIFVIILGLLSASTLSLFLWARKQAKQVRISHIKMQRILDHIDEGLLTVDRRMEVGDEASKHLETFVGSIHAIKGQDFIKTVFAKSRISLDSQSMIRQVLQASFGEDRLAWDLNEGNLPRETQFESNGTKTLAIRWIPIFDSSDKLTHLLVSLADITRERELEKAFGTQRKYLQSLPETLSEVIQIPYDRLHSLLDQTESIMNSLSADRAHLEHMRSIHTQKGVARTLGLKSLSQELHELESILQPTNLEVSKTLQEQVTAVLHRLAECRSFSNILQKGRRELPAAKAAWMAPVLIAPFQSWLQQMHEEGLPIRAVHLIDKIIDWSEGDLILLQDLCTHAVTNSLDHGFLLPKKRGEDIANPTIEIQATPVADQICIEIRDNGVGLNLILLQELAQKKGFVPRIDETIADFVFYDGVSTADEVTLSSGRGMGLAAVKAQVEIRGGTVRMMNNPSGSGSCLRAIFPAQDLVKKASAS